MESRKTRYAILRDKTNWDSVTTTGLQVERNGALTLARIPGTVDGQRITLPILVNFELSGLAVGDCRNTYLADTANHRVIWMDGVCKARMVIPGRNGNGNAPGQFNQPRGLLVVNDNLYVADSGNGRVQVFRLPTLELRAIWEEALQTPTGLAADSRGRVYVLDRGRGTVLRFSAWGVPDEPYNTAMLNHVSRKSLYGLAIDEQDILYVSDDLSKRVLRFDVEVKALAKLPQAGGPLHPRALTARGKRLYIANADDGLVWVYDCKTQSYIGTLADYRGPVSAMAVDETGALYLKPGLDETIHRLQANAACVAKGTLTTGPLDAGSGEEWARAHVQAEVPKGTALTLFTYVSDDRTNSPSNAHWIAAPALDILIPPLPGQNSGQPTQKRFLWLRVQMQSDDRRTSPRLIQVQAETNSGSYLNHLPAIYSRDDEPHRFLARWLALFRSRLADWETALEEMPHRFDPVTTPEDQLPWLASWLAFELPLGPEAEALRALLQRVPELYQRRGTPSGLRDFVQLYTGVRPSIFEAFRERRVWRLGENSVLGFDTALAAGAPEGMIVSGLTLADPQYMGLRGDYYSGLDFAQPMLTRTDPIIDFDSRRPPPDSPFQTDLFSVRWTGQIQPRFSEVYTFSTYTDDGVRLWVDGQLIIDKWVDQAPTEHSGKIVLNAGQWYAITMEYYENQGIAVAKLYWSSRSQAREIVPQTRLYSVRDERANLDAPSAGQTIMVGQTVVGESGPLAESDFGVPLFSETAHVFTVVVPAAEVPDLAAQQALRRMVEAEKPAHTDFHLCFIDAQMRVGFQARIGIDTIVAGPPAPLELDVTTLGFDSHLATEEEEGMAGRIGKRSRVGHNTIIG